MTDPKQRAQLDRLSENIESRFTLTCFQSTNGILHSEDITGCFDETEAIDALYENGWRVIRGKVYCPDCVEAKRK